VEQRLNSGPVPPYPKKFIKGAYSEEKDHNLTPGRKTSEALEEQKRSVFEEERPLSPSS